MIPILSQLLCDNESLFEYERYWGTSRQVSIGQVQRRLIAIERQNAPIKHDSYYEGLAKNALAAYRDLPDLIGGIPYDLAKEYLISVNHELYVKADRFTEWMELIKQFPPLLLIQVLQFGRNHEFIVVRILFFHHSFQRGVIVVFHTVFGAV